MRLADPLISVIVPAHNAEQFIERTLQSAARQTYRQIEIIVVDDGSTDATAAIVESLARQDSRIHLYRTPNRGPSAARNFGVSKARGAYLAPLDADDIWLPEKLAWQFNVMRHAQKTVGVVYCWSVGIDEDDRILIRNWSNCRESGNVFYALVIEGILGNGSTPLIRRSFFEAVGGYDETLRYGEDWKLYLALAAVSEFDVVPHYLTGYRQRPGSASLNLEAMDASIAKVTSWIKQSWPHVPEHSLRQRAHNVNTYLAFLALRRGSFLQAFRFRARAYAAEPARFWTWSTVEFLALFYSHLLGIRRYNWCFWRTLPALADMGMAFQPIAAPPVFFPLPLRSGAAEIFKSVEASN